LGFWGESPLEWRRFGMADLRNGGAEPARQYSLFSSAMLVGFGVCGVPISHPTTHMIIQWIETWRLNISEVISKSDRVAI